ncbi:MAG: hypothetical protein V3569_05465 [Acholeplasmataceae bacterium]|nr:hypothetical protein [Acholeplasmataceae bacterium]
MYHKWIWAIFYIMLISTVTYIVASFSEAAKANDFLAEREDILMSDHRALIQASVIANNHNSTDAYVLAEPLYQEIFNNEFFNLEVSIYPLVEFKDDKAHNSVAILLSDIKITDPDAILDENDYHFIKAYLTFDKNIKIGETSKNVFIESMTTLYDNSARLIIINQDLLVSNGEPVEFEVIKFTYEIDMEIDETLVMLYNEDLTAQYGSDKFDESFNRDISNVSSTNLDLLEQCSLSSFKSCESIYYNSNLLHEFLSYNHYYLRYIGIEILIVIPITYLLFFHQYVKKVIKNKKTSNI